MWLFAALVTTSLAKPVGQRAPVRHPDPDGALGTCLSGAEAARTGDPAAMLPTLMAACAPIYAEMSCREAWARTGPAPPAEKAQWTADAISVCARAYCPILPEPKPGACTGEPGDAVPDWGEVQLAILEFDLGPERAAAFRAGMNQLFSRSLGSVSVEVDPKWAPSCVTATSIEMRADGVWIATSGGRRRVAPCHGALDRAALAAELCRANEDRDNTCLDKVTFVADRATPYSDLLTVLDLALLAGFDDVWFAGVESPSTPASPAAEVVPPQCGEAPAPCPTR